jgi:tetratricopeptide (TPR) repeat protein
VQAVVTVRALVYQGMQSARTAPVCVQAARALLLIGDEDQAVSLLREALDLDPLLPDPYLLLGDWYESKGMKMLPL